MTTFIGLVAATLTTLSFLPQALKAWRTKSAGDLSFGTFSMFCVGVVLWLVYGILLGDLPIILSNVVTFFLASSILVQMIVYRRREKAARNA